WSVNRHYPSSVASLPVPPPRRPVPPALPRARPIADVQFKIPAVTVDIDGTIHHVGDHFSADIPKSHRTVNVFRIHLAHQTYDADWPVRSLKLNGSAPRCVNNQIGHPRDLVARALDQHLPGFDRKRNLVQRCLSL